MSIALERTGRRTADRLFSEWHRDNLPAYAGLIDLDYVAFCRRCFKALVLIETAIDSGESKPSMVTRDLARDGIEAFVLLIRPTAGDVAIHSASLRQIAPIEEPASHEVTGKELRAELIAARKRAARAVGCPHEEHR
jgi:hypothetical protein